MTALRRGLPPLPSRFQKLPIDARGYPIPWFVSEVNGVRDFRLADAGKRLRAVKHRLCWLCGERLGRLMTFVIGPMCAVNRNTSEPPCHKDCAEFSVKACPFMTLPEAQYRSAHIPEEARQQPMALPGNPGGACLWITDSYRPYRVPGSSSSWLIRIGEPVEVSWWARGRPATREEVMAMLETRLPLLREMADQEGSEAQAALARQVEITMALLPA